MKDRQKLTIKIGRRTRLEKRRGGALFPRRGCGSHRRLQKGIEKIAARRGKQRLAENQGRRAKKQRREIRRWDTVSR